MSNPLEELKKNKEKIEDILGVGFIHENLLFLAFVHRSFVHENKDLIEEHNERLEFLGDSVLGLVMADFLYKKFPDHPEGELSHLRSRLVEASTCIHFLQLLQLESHILLGKGESQNSGKRRSSIFSDVFEALIGAIYLDQGFHKVEAFVLRHFKEEIEKIIAQPSSNFKAKLQDHTQKKYHTQPVYKIMREEGPDHAKEFTIGVYVDYVLIGKGEGSSKKEAEQKAAEAALQTIEQNGETEDDLGM